ncbi:hypothetical protein FOC75_00860 [Bacillus cereus]|nr:hypothetical protein [Bacillus cereus]AJH65330.1 hypothetical protein BG11_3141 [Bacillus cereus]AJK36608.1 hypothetical protein BF33_3728 [Bacillus cereus]KWU67790.1 hypothetical protein AWW71_06070 [Bacillus cereus]KWW52405.1 hypothetical protein AWW69_03860 [Bacillus cereus]MDQ4440174.1 hypothetical protein [Bacillus cereus]
MSVYQLNYDDIVALEQKMIRLPGKMEPAINNVLHTDGIRIATEEITKLIPVSKSKWGIRNKIHARNSNWSKSEKLNLGFKIVARGGAANKKGSFGYLVFPNEGRGSHNPLEQRFAEQGLINATPKILEKLHEGVDRVLKEEF